MGVRTPDQANHGGGDGLNATEFNFFFFLYLPPYGE